MTVVFLTLAVLAQGGVGTVDTDHFQWCIAFSLGTGFSVPRTAITKLFLILPSTVCSTPGCLRAWQLPQRFLASD